MQNAWNVQFVKEGQIVIKVFEGDSPKASGAVGFARDLATHGILYEIISRRRAFAPPASKATPPGHGLLWCPYCIKWREFDTLVVVRPTYETPPLLRCTVCLVSVADHWIRKYNPVFVERHAIEQEMRTAKAPVKPKIRRRR